MDSSIFLIALSLFTFAAVIFFAMRSRQKTLDRLNDPKMHRDENKSTLAKDAPDH
ncbi:MAG: hypothetical protein II336_17220 [Loktanella sp.]|nr:hypothetical protein [Loktanella sp.]